MTAAIAYHVPAQNGAHVVNLPGGELGHHSLYLSFDTAPSAGTATVEVRRIGAVGWEALPAASGISVTSGGVSLRSDGPAAAFRVTFSGLVGGAGAALWVATQPTAHPPFQLLTDGAVGPNARLRVDPGQTGFFARRMWRVSYEFTALEATPIVMRVSIPVNFIIHHQGIEIDSGGLSLKAYRSTQGTPGGTFNVPVPIWSANFMNQQSEYTFQAAIDTGGTFTPSAGPVETIRLRTSNATAQRSSVGGESFGERGLAAGTYYLVLARLAGISDTTQGVFTLVVEERP